MKTVRMKVTRSSPHGPLKAGKVYPLPDDLADALARDGAAIVVSGGPPAPRRRAPRIEKATATPPEDAAERSAADDE